MKYHILETRSLSYVVDVPEGTSIEDMRAGDIDSIKYSTERGEPLLLMSLTVHCDVDPATDDEPVDVYLDEECCQIEER